MTSAKDFINNDKAIKSNINKISFDSSYYSSHRIPVVLHRREIGKVFAEVKDDLVVIAGEHQKEHEYLIPKSKIPTLMKSTFVSALQTILRRNLRFG